MFMFCVSWRRPSRIVTTIKCQTEVNSGLIALRAPAVSALMAMRSDLLRFRYVVMRYC